MSERPSPKILVVDDDPSACEMVASSLELEGYMVDRAQSSRQAQELLASNKYGLVVSDIYLGDLTGLDLLRTVQQQDHETRLILMTAHATVETAVAAVRAGAFDYLAKPFDLEDLFRLVRRALDRAAKPGPSLVDPGHAATLSSMIVGRSAPMAEVYRRVARVAATDSNVWISGASGTGKELVAKAIHRHSSRANGRFVTVNCGALAESLLGSELFGHVKGAFTGASSDRRGLFESASGGTLFLDEITETSLAFQVKLLRLLQDGEFRPAGSSVTRRADVRVLAASNLEVDACIREGSFREDLYYRLAAFTIHLPALHERIEDLPLLAEHFLEKLSQDFKHRSTITPSALTMLAAYEWPGNVRQFSNTLEKLAILSPDGVIRGEDVERWLAEMQCQNGAATTLSLTHLEQQKISEVLRQCRGNKTRAAALLGIDRSTLYRKLEAYGIPGESADGSNNSGGDPP
jgi:DNA-binding NtrC family response regulator